jgi:hypothetical protein
LEEIFLAERYFWMNLIERVSALIDDLSPFFSFGAFALRVCSAPLGFTPGLPFLGAKG